MSITPLAGVRIVSFTHFLQGPSATQFLADLGADVIKVEPPGGAFERSWTAPGTLPGGYSPFFACANRNVRSLCIDLKHPDSRSVVLKLISASDVLIESYRPGVMDKLGYGHADVSALNPRIIYASLSGYGADGPYLRRPGQDLLVQAMSGLAAATGSADQPPTPAGASLVDQHAATLAALGILAALIDRERTGRGCLVGTNLLSAALDLQIEPMAYALNGLSGQRSSTGVSSPFYRAPYGIFPTSDGFLAVSLTTPAALQQVFGDDWFSEITPQDEFTLRDEINGRVRQHMAVATTQHWEHHFDAHQIWYAPVNTQAEVINDPQVRHNDSFTSYEQPGIGTVRVLRHPVSYDGVRPGVRTSPPDLGADSDDIVSELGFDAAHLRDSGVLR